MSSASGALPQPRRGRPGPWPPAPPPQPQAQPLSWAKRTGYQPRVSGESLPSASAPNSGQVPLPRPAEAPADLESGPQARPTTALPPPPAATGNGERRQPPPAHPQARTRRRDSDGVRPNGQAAAPSLPQLQEEEETPERPAHVKYELRDTPGMFPLVIYGFQHYISMIGSIILIPLVMIPAMGGSADDTAAVVSTVLLVTGMTTLLHMFVGTRLPLVQGPSFVYLAPALAIMNSPEFFGLNDNNFKHIMKHLQGAIIIGGAFQVALGYTGLMSLFLRVINPVVVSPTVAAVGLSFFSYGFAKLGTCIEMGILQLLMVVIFALYLRKIKLFGYRVFLIYAVPLGLGITWAISFVLTATGVYSYKGCDANIPASNNVSAFCRKHVLRMKSCRVDTSHALRSSPWFRFPYPLQWGTPVFSWKMGLVMCVVSIIASVDSVGSYHASSLFVATRPPTSGVVSRGIGVEGVSTILAGLWGTGVGSATITENVHTIAVTKMGSRRAVGFGAILLLLLSVVGKVGAFIASIPDVMVAALLCFMWAMLCALGLSNLRYSATGSSRNSIIVGLSLFLSLSVPSYFQQYGVHPNTNSSVPTYFQPYIVASHGPVQTGSGGVNYVLNTLLSLNMVIAFLVAVILDNTVPGGRQERGLYVWSEAEAAKRESAFMKDYELPFKIGRAFRCTSKTDSSSVPMRICIYGLLEEKREKMGRGALPVTRPSPSRIRQQLLAPAGRWSSRRGGGSTSSSTARLRQHGKSAEGEEKREERERAAMYLPADRAVGDRERGWRWSRRDGAGDGAAATSIHRTSQDLRRDCSPRRDAGLSGAARASPDGGGSKAEALSVARQGGASSVSGAGLSLRPPAVLDGRSAAGARPRPGRRKGTAGWRKEAGARRWLGWGKPPDPPRMQHRPQLAAFCSTCCGSCWSRYSALPICILQMQLLMQHLPETV